MTFKFKKMTISFAIVGAIISIWTAVVQWNEKKEAEAESAINKSKVEKKEKELQDALNKIINLQAKLLAEQVSEGAKPDFSPSVYGPISPNMIGADIINSSDYPLIDIVVSIQDLEWLENAENMSQEERNKAFSKSFSNYNIGTLPKHSVSTGFFKAKFASNISTKNYQYAIRWKDGLSHGNVAYKRNKDGLFEVVLNKKEESK